MISTDAEGRVAFLNGVAEALTGWPEAEAVGRPLPEVFHIVNEQTREPVESPALRALREGTVAGLANHTVLIARDGTERPIDDSAAPMRDEGGAAAPSITVYFRVPDIRAAVAKVRELGGDATEPVLLPSGWNASCHDDQGVAFDLWEAAEGY